MSQAALTIANGSGAAVRSAINAALLRLATKASGTGRPADIQTGEYWVETDNPGTGVWSLWLYDGASDIIDSLIDSATHALTRVSTTQTPGNNSTRVATTAYADAAAAAAAAGAAASGFINVLRNGTFLSWVRGSSGSIAAAATGAAAIAATGWAVLATGATVAFARIVPGYNGAGASLKVTGATSVTDVTIAQRVEGADAARLAGKTCTFQCAIYNNTGGSITPTIAARYAGSVDSWGAPVADLAASNLQACANNAWTIVAYTFAVHANALDGYEVKIDFGNNFSTSGKFIQIAAADLRVTTGASTGLNASPPSPELPSVADTLARAARYHQSSYVNAVAPGTATAAGLVGVATNYG